MLTGACAPIVGISLFSASREEAYTRVHERINVESWTKGEQSIYRSVPDNLQYYIR